ncbi:MAG: HAMP domain-containing protein [Anaerovibrio sp.]|uniref:SpoIIE family protein phosphatase n=1 Tax=Anaerovibrio sp. TaxID=1872532 RepID=UPI0025BE2E37|nr:SpoIIE family protein phosphatase [Anaerovibrio sp.]MBE6100045.1 HAMP domain-containing protein [Anaerovibrio sp.]
MSIQRKLFLLILAGCGLSLLFLVGPLLYGMTGLYEAIDTKGNNLAQLVSAYTTDFAKEQTKDQLDNEVKIRADIIGYEAGAVQDDVEYLSEELTSILSSPEKFSPVTLPNALYDDVLAGPPYVHYSPRLVEAGVSPELEQEIRLMSNITSSIDIMGKYYKCICIGSKKGYVIRLDIPEEDGELSRLSKAQWRYSYDAQERYWYQLGANSTKPIFTQVYTGSDGKTVVSCVRSYYDHTGQVAGVVVVDCSPLNFLPMEQGNITKSFILGPSGEVLFSSLPKQLLVPDENNQDLRNSSVEGLATLAQNMMSGQTGYQKVRLNNEEYYLYYAPISNMGWSVATLLEKDIVTAAAEHGQQRMMNRMTDFRQSFAMLFIGFGAMALFILVVLFKLVSHVSKRGAEHFYRPIQKLMAGTREIAKGNFSNKIEVDTGDELEQLADNFNDMTEKLAGYEQDIAHTVVENSRLEAELDMAARIQASLLPEPLLVQDTVQLAAVMSPAKEVGGDFYNYYYLNDDNLVVTIADVSDKGVSAALFMAIATTVLKSCIMTELKGGTDEAGHLARAIAVANDQLVAQNEANLSVTAFVGVLNLVDGRFSYVNAGHAQPFIWHDNKMSYLPSPLKIPLLGSIPGIEYEEKTIHLAVGDGLFLYTNGITEAMNESGQLFTDNRLERTLSAVSFLAEPADIISTVRQVVSTHVGSAEQSDDITMLALKYIEKKDYDLAVKNADFKDITRELTVSASVDELPKVLDFIRKLNTDANGSDLAGKQLCLVGEEIFVNIADYAYDEPGGMVKISGKIFHSPAEIEIAFIDEGREYDPLKNPEPDLELSLDDRQVGGLGIFLTKKKVDDMTYTYQDGCNILTIKKKLT